MTTNDAFNRNFIRNESCNEKDESPIENSAAYSEKTRTRTATTDFDGVLNTGGTSIGDDPTVQMLLSPRHGASNNFRLEYLKRLRTFKPHTYFAKPIQLSPIICAVLGWINDGQSTLVCPSCRAKFVILIPGGLPAAATNRLVQKYEHQLLCEAHKPYCIHYKQSLDYYNRFHCTETNENTNTNSSSKQSEIIHEIELVKVVLPAVMGRVLPERTLQLLDLFRPLEMFQDMCKELLINLKLIDQTKLSELDSINAGGGEVSSFLHENSTAGSTGRLRTSVSRAILPLEFVSYRRNTPKSQTKAATPLSVDEISTANPDGDSDEQSVFLDELIRIVSIQNEDKTPDEDEKINKFDITTHNIVTAIAAVLVLCGWELSNYESQNQHLLECSFCDVRRTLDDLFPDLKQIKEGKMSDIEPSVKKSCNAIKAHRFYCPYICGIVQSSSTLSYPLWQVLLERLVIQYEEEHHKGQPKDCPKDVRGDLEESLKQCQGRKRSRNEVVVDAMSEDDGKKKLHSKQRIMSISDAWLPIHNLLSQALSRKKFFKST